jgi:hypothetical protein
MGAFVCRRQGIEILLEEPGEAPRASEGSKRSPKRAGERG